MKTFVFDITKIQRHLKIWQEVKSQWESPGLILEGKDQLNWKLFSTKFEVTAKREER